MKQQMQDALNWLDYAADMLQSHSPVEANRLRWAYENLKGQVEMLEQGHSIETRPRTDRRGRPTLYIVAPQKTGPGI